MREANFKKIIEAIHEKLEHQAEILQNHYYELRECQRRIQRIERLYFDELDKRDKWDYLQRQIIK